MSEAVKGLLTGAMIGLALEADVSARRGYAVTLMRAGDTLHGWRFPAEVLRAAVPGFQGASSFVDHVGWFQQAASLVGLAGVILGQLCVWPVAPWCSW
jgi:hypothetical protein